jgi:GTP cyclohydrolase III
MQPTEYVLDIKCFGEWMPYPCLASEAEVQKIQAEILAANFDARIRPASETAEEG